MRPGPLVALAVALALVAAACGEDASTASGSDAGTASETPPTEAPATGGPTEPPSPESPSPESPSPESSACDADQLGGADGPVGITFWHASTGVNGEVLGQLVDDYNARQDAVVVDLQFQGTYGETFDKYINTLRSQGQLPDIIQLDEVTMQQMMDSESIVFVQDCIDGDAFDTSQFIGGLVDQYSVGGALVTMPFQLSNPILYYDAADFTAAGLDPDDPPTTLQELVDTSAALVDSGVVPYGMSLNTWSWFFEQWMNMSGEPLVNEENGRDGRATAALLESAAAHEIMEFLATMRDEELLLDTGQRSNQTQSQLDKFLAIGVGNASMTIGTSAALGEIYAQISGFPDVEVAVAPMPGPSGGGTAVGGGSLYMVAGSSAAEQAAVWDLMKWLNEPQQQITWSAGTGFVPTVAGAIDEPELEALWDELPAFRVAYDQIVTTGPVAGGGGPLIGNYTGFRDAINGGLEDLMGGADPATALAAAQAEADAAIGDYNRRIGG